MHALVFRLRQLQWDLASGLLFRPFLIIAGLATVGELLPLLEAQHPPPDLVHRWLATEPGSAQVVLGTLAGATMTVVSVVYSILVVALSLASVQFSTRIVAGFLRDPASQRTLGLLVGTFAYALVVLRSVRTDPPFVPELAVAGAIALALASLAALVWFIHHIANQIQANTLVDRLATETEAVIDEVFGETPLIEAPVTVPAIPMITIRATRSGYLQLADRDRLRALAANGAWVVVARGVGQFVAERAELARIGPPERVGPEVVRELHAAFDLGAGRTMQQDVEWGFRQIVDIALKAISPAVNDPSTAATCIDHLGRLLIRAAHRHAPARVDRVGDGGVSLPVPTTADLVDLAFEQLRQYGRADMAVALRLIRAAHDVADATTDPTVHRRLAAHTRLLDASVRAAFPVDDCEELGRRVAAALAATERVDA
ncbi:MAG: DUF2254 domain-containing protein [Myxococcota bacterium]